MMLRAGWATRMERLSRTRGARRRTRELARTAEHLLRPGLYLRAGESIWRHWRAVLPRHLRQSKLDARSGTPRALIVNAAHRLLPPLVLRVGRGRGGSFSIVVSADDGGLVLLAPEHGRVARTYGSRRIDDDYVSLRRRFETHVVTPAFEVRDGGRLLVEEFVHGDHFLDLEPDHQLGVVRDLVRRYAELGTHEGEGDSRDPVATTRAAVARGSPPGEVAELLSSSRIEAWSRAWPLVPSATDANVKNLIIRSDRTPVLIDLGRIRLDPVFYYPVGVVVMARGHVLDRFLAGDLDDDLHALAPGGTAQNRLDDEIRRSLLALRVAMVSYRRASTSGTFDRAAFDDILAYRWSALWSGVPATYTGSYPADSRSAPGPSSAPGAGPASGSNEGRTA
ncbi:hypothetical protein [Georgenia sp. Z1491]|uniref:hypothetical protein n=1 Tax=Georgenia sp. Z1491 TaxID=3416707 RepID=UPI003CF694AC